MGTIDLCRRYRDPRKPHLMRYWILLMLHICIFSFVHLAHPNPPLPRIAAQAHAKRKNGSRGSCSLAQLFKSDPVVFDGLSASFNIPRDPSTSSKGTWTLQTHPSPTFSEGTTGSIGYLSIYLSAHVVDSLTDFRPQRDSVILEMKASFQATASGFAVMAGVTGNFI